VGQAYAVVVTDAPEAGDHVVAFFAQVMDALARGIMKGAAKSRVRTAKNKLLLFKDLQGSVVLCEIKSFQSGQGLATDWKPTWPHWLTLLSLPSIRLLSAKKVRE
jgi:hypothetical protein